MNYTIYWLDGKFEKVSGSSISDAFTKAGLGAGAIRAVVWTSMKKVIF